MKKLPLINLILLIGIIAYQVSISIKKHNTKNDIIPEINAERINIVGKDGNKYVVLSSPEKQALSTTNGKPTNPEKKERKVAGLLFFNEEGDEIGGLTYGIDNTNSYQLLTFDQRKSDQIMTLRNNEYLENETWYRQYGLLLQERSDKQGNIMVAELNKIRAIKDSIKREKAFKKFYSKPENLAPRRLFVGRTYSEEVGLFLMDKNNKPRLQIYLDKNGNPHIESINEKGEKTNLK